MLNRIVTISNYLMMAEDVLLLGGNHSYDDLETPMMFQGGSGKTPLVIDDDVWIGARKLVFSV